MFKFKCQNPMVRLRSPLALSEVEVSKSKINSNVKCQMSKPKFCHLSFVLCAYFVICALSFVILMSGCAMIKEGAKGFTGISTKALEDSRKNAIKNTFDVDFDTCYERVKRRLGNMGAYIYAEDIKKKMLAIYVSTSDTTAVGIFFNEIDANNTQVEVSSPSTYAKELIAGRLFKPLSPEEEPIQPDAQKE